MNIATTKAQPKGQPKSLSLPNILTYARIAAIPVVVGCVFAESIMEGPLWLRWYATGGKEGAEPPPAMKRIVEIVDKARTAAPDEQVKLSQELYRIWAENLFEIGTIGLTPMVQGVVVAGTRFQNLPKTLGNDWPLRSPGNARTEQFFFTK